MPEHKPWFEMKWGRILSERGYIEFSFGVGHSYCANWEVRDADLNGYSCRCVLFSKILRYKMVTGKRSSTRIDNDLLVEHLNADFSIHEPMEPTPQLNIPVEPYNEDDWSVFKDHFQPAAENILDFHERHLSNTEEKS